MPKPSLVIMAAGLGSRYGGAKQIAPVDLSGHLLIDYSIFDAVRAGFEDVVIIVKPELEREFHEAIGARIERAVHLVYAHQTLDALPPGFSVPDGRQKPWGTAHAVLSAKAHVKGPFAVINADDFYGRQAFEVLYGFLSADRAANEHAMVGYRIGNTLTEHGRVARGVCAVADGRLTGIVERTHIVARPDGAAYTEDGVTFIGLPEDTTVSMNLWGFQASMMDEIEARFEAFLRDALDGNPLKCEYFLPSVPDALIREGLASVEVLRTDAKWHGVTYAEDMPRVRAALKAMRDAGAYPEALWG